MRHDKDAVEQAAREGSRRTGEALSQLLGEQVDARNLEIHYVEQANAAILLSLDVRHDQAALGRMEISGEISGRAFVAISERSMTELLRVFNTEYEAGAALDELGLSMLREVANITASSYLNALADAWGIMAVPSVVDLEIGALGLSGELEEAARRQGPAFVVRCDLETPSGRFDVSLVLLVDPASVIPSVTNS